MLLTRNPDLVLGWGRAGVRIRNPATGVEIVAPGVAETLALFDKPRSVEATIRELPPIERKSARATIRALRIGRFLLPTGRTRRAVEPSRLDLWKGNLASAQYHGACRDLRYFQKPSEVRRHIQSAVLSVPRPPVFVEYTGAPAFDLPKAELVGDPAVVGRVLRGRRTVRRFRKAPVPISRLAQLLRCTFGLTGMLVTEFGALATRTSPSAGALHPIEAYVLAWNVEGLSAGLYHFDVLGDSLRQLRRGDLRQAAVGAASGQKWIAHAAFLCILTAAFPRVLWKYPAERSYRNLFLDAGHLAQTFCLVATSLGLGPFTTAAIQDTKIEKLLRIDGVEEFPVYLCGAGVPAKETRPLGGKPALL